MEERNAIKDKVNRAMRMQRNECGVLAVIEGGM
jgi:hypothetical protein